MTAIPPRIRAARATDADDLFDLATQLATSAVPQRPAFDRSLSQILTDDDELLLVADDDQRLLGYLYGLVHPAFHANGLIGWVEELIVDASTRASGLGRRLMTDFEHWAFEECDARYISLATRRAGDFYQRIGYQESATYFKRNRPDR